MKKIAIASLLVMVLASSPVSAADALPCPHGSAGCSSKSSTSWYGYQPMLADAAVLGLLTGSFLTFRMGRFDLCFAGPRCPQTPRPDNTLSNTLLISAATTFALASPTMHAMHGHWGKAGASLALRAAPLVVGVAIAGGASTGGAQDRERGLLVFGAGLAVVGPIAAMVIDDAFLAREPVLAKDATSLRVVPTIDLVQRGAGIAMGGAF
jgi:hypothetical protein